MRDKGIILLLLFSLILIIDAASQYPQIPSECVGNCSDTQGCMSSLQSCESYIQANGDLLAVRESIIRQEAYSDPSIDTASVDNLKSSWCSLCCDYGFSGDSVHPCIFSCPCVYEAPSTTLNIWDTEKRPTLNQSISAVADSLNYNVCFFLNMMWLIISAIASLMIIYAGYTYFNTSDVTRRGRSKKMVIYSVAGLVLALVACPGIDYLIENTDVTPFQSSCRCYEPMVYREGVSPTMPPIPGISTRPPTSTTMPKPDGSPCERGYECISEICTRDGFCCQEHQCGYAYNCYDPGEEKPDGAVCDDDGLWKRKNNESCFKDLDCLSDNCNDGFCCPEGECWYLDRCYTDGSTRQPGSIECRNEVWLTTTTTTTSTTTTTRPVPVKLRIVFVRLDDMALGTFNSAVDSQANFLISNIPLKDCPSSVEIIRVEQNCINLPTDQTTCMNNALSILSSIENCARSAGYTYHYFVGLGDTGHCGTSLQGFSDGPGGSPAVYVKYPYEVVAVHELGHDWGLNDEYCSQNCAGCPAGPPNPLSAAEGCNPNPGAGCCGACAGYSVYCQGNQNSVGGRCVMSYANAPSPRAFCDLCWNHLLTIPQLNC